MWNDPEGLRDKWLATVRSAQDDATAAIEAGAYDADAQAAFQRKFDEGVDYRKQAEELEARNEAAGRDCMRTMENFPGGGAPDLNLNRTFATEGSYFAECRSRGWPNRCDTEYEGLELGRYLKAAVYGTGSLQGAPDADLYIRALNEGTDTAGGHLVPTPLAARVIDALRNELTIRQAGAQIVPMESETLKIAKVTGDPSGGWRAELSTGATVDPTYGAVTLTAHTYRALVVGSREVTADSPNLESVLRNQFVASIAQEIDRTALLGVGSTGNEPLGLSNSTGIPTVEVGSTTGGGAVLTYNALLDGLETLMGNNAARAGSRIAAIMSPRSYIELSKLQEASTDQGQTIRVPPALENVSFFPTAAVPNTFGWGATTSATEIYLGDYNSMILGQRDAAGVELLRERYANQFAFGWLAWTRADVAVEHDESFVVLRGIKQTT